MSFSFPNQPPSSLSSYSSSSFVHFLPLLRLLSLFIVPPRFLNPSSVYSSFLSKSSLFPQIFVIRLFFLRLLFPFLHPSFLLLFVLSTSIPSPLHPPSIFPISHSVVDVTERRGRFHLSRRPFPAHFPLNPYIHHITPSRFCSPSPLLSFLPLHTPPKLTDRRTYVNGTRFADTLKRPHPRIPAADD